MAKSVARTDGNNDAPVPERWKPPTSDMEFKVEGPNSIPDWGDKGWAAWDSGPAVAVPSGDAYGGPGPYGTKVARQGDTVKFVAATYGKSAHFEVIEGVPSPEDVTPKPPQQSGASYEDLIKGGWLAKGDLPESAREAIAARSPGMRAFLESDAEPDKVNVKDHVLG